MLDVKGNNILRNSLHNYGNVVTLRSLQENCTLLYNERKWVLTYSFTKFETGKTRTMPAENNVYYFPELHFSV